MFRRLRLFGGRYQIFIPKVNQNRYIQTVLKTNKGVYKKFRKTFQDPSRDLSNFFSYLVGRSQYVRFNNTMSDLFNVTSGVPQEIGRASCRERV